METDPYGVNKSFWYYQAEQTGAESLQGNHGTYEGGGYMVKLKSNRCDLTFV